MPESKTKHVPTPDFSLWQHDTVVKFATECYRKLQELTEANEQLRADLKDAMALVRKTNFGEGV